MSESAKPLPENTLRYLWLYHNVGGVGILAAFALFLEIHLGQPLGLAKALALLLFLNGVFFFFAAFGIYAFLFSKLADPVTSTARSGLSLVTLPLLLGLLMLLPFSWVQTFWLVGVFLVPHVLTEVLHIVLLVYNPAYTAWYNALRSTP